MTDEEVELAIDVALAAIKNLHYKNGDLAGASEDLSSAAEALREHFGGRQS